MENTPYKRQLDKNGILLNPITKENPYLHKANISLQKLFNYRKTSKFKIWEANRNKFFKGKVAVGT